MLNHARNLLMNVAGSAVVATDFPAEEIVPVEYRALTLPTYLVRLRQQIYGTSPDRYMLNYRTKQLLTMLHATELAEFIYSLDSRLSYNLPQDQSLVVNDLFIPQVNSLDLVAVELSIAGEPAAPDLAGKLYSSFRVTLSGGTAAILDTASGSTIPASYAASGSVPLGDTGYALVFPTVASASWHVNVLRRPQWDLGQIATNLTAIGEPALLSLFGTSQAEPWNTFRNLWYDHKELAYKLGGLILAMIYRSEEVRNGQA